MKKIANILTENLFNDNVLYNVVKKKSDLIEGIPTLCVGVALTKKNYPDFNIINMDIDDLTKWTYGPREKRNVYEQRLSKFIFDSMEKYVKSVEYSYINIIVDGFDNDDFRRVMYLIGGSLENKTTSYFYNGVVYIFDNDNNKVFGLSIREFSYCDADYKPFLRKVYNNTRVIMDKDFINLSVRTLFSNYKYAIPSVFY